MDEFSSFIVNISSPTRKETLEGREYIVAPLAMLPGEGVVPGSDGPGFYPKEETSKNPNSWNHRPIVINHPQYKGKGISACTPEIIEERKVGMMFNSKYDDKLRSEAWIDIEKCKTVKHGEKVLEALEKNLPMEASTGLNCDKEIKDGVFNNEKYNWTARNYRPDHLALLPDSIGAYPIEKGGGLMVTNASDMSHSGKRRSIQQHLDKTGGGWVEDVYDKFFIHTDMNNQLMKRDYETKKDNAIHVKGDAVPVQRVTEYRDMAGAFVGNSITTNSEKGFLMNKKELVDSLISNGETTGWVEADREWLSQLNEDRLVKLRKALPPPPAPVVTNVTPPVVIPTPAPVVGNNQQPQTVQEVLNNIANPEVRQFLQIGVNIQNQQKEQMIATIIANKKNQLPVEYLRTITDWNLLQNMANMAAQEIAQQQQRIPNYGGAAGLAPVVPGSVVMNTNGQSVPAVPMVLNEIHAKVDWKEGREKIAKAMGNR